MVPLFLGSGIIFMDIRNEQNKVATTQVGNRLREKVRWSAKLHMNRSLG